MLSEQAYDDLYFSVEKIDDLIFKLSNTSDNIDDPKLRKYLTTNLDDIAYKIKRLKEKIDGY